MMTSEARLLQGRAAILFYYPGLGGGAVNDSAPSHLDKWNALPKHYQSCRAGGTL